MKQFLTLICILCTAATVLAEIPANKIKNPPSGTFKKMRNGDFVQYDKNGKKIGIYKINNGKLYRKK